MNLNDIDEETERKLQEIAEDDEVASNVGGLVIFLQRIKKEKNLSDEETEILSYMVINKLSFEIETWLTGYSDEINTNECGKK